MRHQCTWCGARAAGSDGSCLCRGQPPSAFSSFEVRHSNFTRLNISAHSSESQQYQDVQNALACIGVPGNGLGCMSNIGVPVIEDVVFGGLTCVEGPNSTERHLCAGSCDRAADALIITILLNDMPTVQAGAELWEKDVFLPAVSGFSDSDLQASYMSEVQGVRVLCVVCARRVPLVAATSGSCCGVLRVDWPLRVLLVATVVVPVSFL